MSARILIGILCVCSCSLTVFAQGGKRITGTVADEKGEPVIGANVIEKGTTNGNITDVDGNFSLDVSPGATLVISFIGYNTQEVVTGNQTTLNITLVENLQALEEVIVIGYGTAKRQDYTGSVASVKLENSAVSILPNLNVLESLKGNVTGMNIGATNSAGGEPSMLIRGQNSINGSNNPLIILDGVIFMGSLGDINPNDIANIDVLKDAVTSAAYGSRSSNGVISIVTKKGRSAKPVITLNASTGIQAWPNRPEMMKGEDFVRVVNERSGNPVGTTSWMRSVSKANYENGIESVWLDEVTRTGILEDYQISISGTGKGLNYYLSTSYNENKGIVIGDDFNRISLFGKINTDITSWLNIGVDAAFSRRDYSGAGADISTAQVLPPYAKFYRDDEGNLEKYPDEQSFTNPLWNAKSGTLDNSDIRQNLRLNTYAVISLPWVKGLSYRLNFLPNVDQTRQGNFYYEGNYVQEGSGIERYSPSALQGLLSKANGNLLNSRTYSYVLDNIVNYKNAFGKHSVEGTLVATRDYSKIDVEYMTGSDFSENGNTTLGLRGLHKAKVQNINFASNSGGVKRTNIGYLARANYGFDNKYYLTGSYRRDGASVFGANRKWGNFAATGVAWRISEEEFMTSIEPLNNLKLKVSWGQNGNQGIAPYTTLSQVINGSTGGLRYEFAAPGTIYYGLNQSNLGNSDLGWERTEAWNFGFESSWLQNRLSVDLDIYVSKTLDQIFNRNIPVMSGFKTIYTSMGQVNNRGFELNLRSVNIEQRDLNWTTNFTFWLNRNKLVHLYGDDLDGDGKEDDDIGSSLFIGKSLGAIYGYKQIGIVQEDDTEYIAATGATPGFPKYADLDGVAGISAADRTILGYNKENFRLNMGNILRYKGLELYVLLTGNLGGNGYYMSDNAEAYLMMRSGYSTDNTILKPYWTPENRSNEYPGINFSGDGRFRGLQSRGFVRIQDLSLSYTFNQSWVKSANISMLKVFLAAKNLATFTGWDGGDPETGARYLSGTYPVASTYSLGFNISF
ncbi:MAG: TonB-dependent receptor [Tannerella sp.]|nr:TonB-dependent receptor [Tannerella sp.]